jgi:hypothetical protein
VFAVETAPERGTTVKLVVGFAEVTGAGGPQSLVVVGPGQGTFVPSNGDPEPPRSMQLDSTERAAAAVLRTSGPQPSFGRPDAGNSRVLADIVARGTIRVGVDSDGSSTQTYAFSKRYFGFLAASWGIRLDLTAASGGKLLDALATGGLDAVVTAVDISNQKVTGLPFVASPSKRRRVKAAAPEATWQLVLPPDKTYAEAMTSFLKNTLLVGRYGELYRPSFGGAEAPYEPLRSVLP